MAISIFTVSESILVTAIPFSQFPDLTKCFLCLLWVPVQAHISGHLCKHTSATQRHSRTNFYKHIVIQQLSNPRRLVPL